MNLQARYDLEVEKDRLEDRIESEVKVFELPVSQRERLGAESKGRRAA
jgi:hypothetical protein